MIETKDFAKNAEQDLRGNRKLALSTCRAWDELSPASKAALAPAMNFLGCDKQNVDGQSVPATEQADRIAACRLMLLLLGLDGREPAWSSYMLDQMLERVMEPLGGSVGDLFHALYSLLANYPSTLSPVVANLVKQLVVTCYTRHRSSYDAVDWDWFAQQASAGATPAQLYLALHALPPALVNVQLSQKITSAFASTPFHAESEAALAG